MSEISTESTKSGFVAVAGKPNTGKSTLINALLGQKIAAVSPRPQTTRKNQLGILTIENDESTVQIIFTDTPGIHKPKHKLGEKMVSEATSILNTSDLVVAMIDGTTTPTDDDQILFDFILNAIDQDKVLKVINKIDRINESELTGINESYSIFSPRSETMMVSALIGTNLDQLIDQIIEFIPPGEPYFPTDQITDLYERDIAADLIREASLNILRDEVPHGIAVRIDQFQERDSTGAYIEATIFVERESHKAIVIGKNGRTIKKIGMHARSEIEKMSGRKVYLHLKVKVRKNWRNDENILRRFGYS